MNGFAIPLFYLDMEQQTALDRLRRRLRKGITFSSEEYPQEFLLSLAGTPPENPNLWKKSLKDEERKSYEPTPLQKANGKFLFEAMKDTPMEDNSAIC
jgi:hypothetical protein